MHLFGEPCEHSFREPAAKFLAESQHKRSLERDERAQAALDPFIGSLSLQRVHHETLAPYIRSRLEKGRSAGTINRILGLLHRRGGMTPKALTETTGMSAATMTTVIDRLEQAGYVERQRRGADRRSFTVHAAKGSEGKVERLYKSLLLASQAFCPTTPKKRRL